MMDFNETIAEMTKYAKDLSELRQTLSHQDENIAILRKFVNEKEAECEAKLAELTKFVKENLNLLAGRSVNIPTCHGQCDSFTLGHLVVKLAFKRLDVDWSVILFLDGDGTDEVYKKFPCVDANWVRRSNEDNCDIDYWMGASRAMKRELAICDYMTNCVYNFLQKKLSEANISLVNIKAAVSEAKGE